MTIVKSSAPSATKISKTGCHKGKTVHGEKTAGFLESEQEGIKVGEPLFRVIPVPLEQTVSYGGGTGRGPGAILAASQQLEVWDGFSEPLAAGIATEPVVDCTGDIHGVLARIEAAVRAAVEKKAIPVVLGGEHSVSLAPIRVLAASCPEPIGIIQIDAHADLRDSFEGLPFSHACVMRRALEECGCALMQFGVRALCREEVRYRRQRRVLHLDGREIYGVDLKKISLPAAFPHHIYLTIDVDGLDPSVIAATGTPVPGGPGWYDTLIFIERVLAGRRLLGFDLVELAPRPGDHGSDFAAAQLVYAVIGMVARNLGRG